MTNAEDRNDKRACILRKYYGKSITVYGTISDNRESKKDKKEQIEFNDDYNNACKNNKIVNSIYFSSEFTLLTDVKIKDKDEYLDHLWISENILEQLPSLKINDKVGVEGVVRKYCKHNGAEEDYCINEYHVYPYGNDMAKKKYDSV